MNNFKITWIKPFALLLTACSLVEVPEEISDPADPKYNLIAPILLTAEAITDSRIELTWKNNESHTKEFVVQRKSGSESFSTIGTVTKNILTFTDTVCVLGIEYSYVVQSKVESNVSVNSNTLKRATNFPGPGNLNAITNSDESIRLTWTDNTGFEAGFKIERDGDSGFTEVGTVSSDVTEYTDTGLTFGHSYDYRVAAYSSVNTSSWATVTAVVEFAAPTNLSAMGISDSEIELTWTDNTGYETGFKIERDSGSGFTEIGTVSSDVTEYTDTGLTFGQSYTYRIAAFTSVNTSSWVTIIFTTEFPAPTNLTALSISDTEIELNWTDNCSFESGYRIERDGGSGFVQVAEVSANSTNYTDNGLIMGTSYDYRIFAFTDANDSDYSATATAIATMPLVDYDGNVYETVQIGNQTWMAENLKVTHFRDGTAITNITDDTTWAALTTEAYCIYNNNASNEVDTYGALYNWLAVTDGRNIAPEGWHVPTDDEWQVLVDFMGGDTVAGGKMKEAGTTHWEAPNTRATNESGFTALPGGYRDYDGDGPYSYMGLYGFFWSATESDSYSARWRELGYNYSGVERYFDSKNYGFAVRLLRD